MKQFIELQGERFEVKNSKGHVGQLRERTLWDCYGRPSRYKEEIFEYWREWAYKSGVICFGVASYNSNMFTLEGLYTDENGQDHYIYITKTRQEMYRI